MAPGYKLHNERVFFNFVPYSILIRVSNHLFSPSLVPVLQFITKLRLPHSKNSTKGHFSVVLHILSFSVRQATPFHQV